MMARIIEAIFPALKKKREARALAAQMLSGIVELEVATRAMHEAAKAGGAYALLTPIVPAGSQPSAGWFGGSPHLPPDLAWPEKEGNPYLFAAQINLSALPPALWSGAGPRQGWLALFFAPDSAEAKALHFKGPTAPREGPAQKDAVWAWPRSYDDREGVRDHTPQWPFAVEAGYGDLPKPLGYRKGKARGFSDPSDGERPNLADAAYQPFDTPTCNLLLQCVRDQLEYCATNAAEMLKRPLRDADREAFRSGAETMRTALFEFAAIERELAPFKESFDLAQTQQTMWRRLARLPTIDTSYLGDQDGFAVVEIASQTLSDRPSHGYRWWWWSYKSGLEQHAKYAYSEGRLHSALRERLETQWRFDALHERAIMGRAPEGFIYTPHGPDTPNEVLIELKTSDLAGWAWGDMYSVVLLIDRKALERGDFSTIHSDIAN